MDKNTINSIKNDPEKVKKFLIEETTLKEKLHFLERLGHLDASFDKRSLITLLSDPNDQIRYLALKNLAKFSDINLLDTFFYMVTHDEASTVRREAVSGIGRLRNQLSIPYLFRILEDEDPKVIIQAIRGLLVFRNRPDVMEELRGLRNHPNEIIQDFLNKEFSEKNSKLDTGATEVNPILRNLVVLGDVLETLSVVPTNSIHLTFTSPPYYNARDYSIYKSYEQYLTFLEKVFQEVYRVTKDGRYFVLNTSPIIIPRIGRSYSSKRYPIPYDIHPLLKEIGWEFIDDIVWVKPETSVKNRNAGFIQHRKPLAYKPNAVTEMLMVYRKNTGKLIDWNIHQYSVDVVRESKVLGDFETNNVWKIDPTFDKVHSAVFPIGLCDRVITYYSMKGDLVFDPFAGSGTVGKSAINHKRNFFLTEIDPTYFETMKDRLLIFEGKNRTELGATFLSIDEFKKRMSK